MIDVGVNVGGARFNLIWTARASVSLVMSVLSRISGGPGDGGVSFEGEGREAVRMT